MLLVIIFISISLIIPLQKLNGQVNSSQGELEKEKLQKEIELLEKQIEKESSPFDLLLQQGIAVIGIVTAGAITFFFTWQRERRIPPTAEAEKIMQALVEQWYNRNYLKFYYKMWRDIQESDNRGDQIEKYWNMLSQKEFPIEGFEQEKKDFDYQKIILENYLKNHLHISKENVRDRMDWIENNANVKFYERARVDLPKLIELGVKATIAGRSNIDEKDLPDLVQEALKKIRELMVFSFIREDKEIIKIYVESKISDFILEMKNSNNAKSEDDD